MTKIGDAISSKVEVVRYFLRLVDEETEDKVVYIEPGVPITIINESIESNQRSVMSFPVIVWGYINESDTRILDDFMDEVTKALFTTTQIANYRDAFATGDGFSIERATFTEIGLGEEYCQFKLVLECMFHHPN